MKPTIKAVILVIMMVLLCGTAVRGDTIEESYAKAKLYLFDKQWGKALDVLDDLIKRYPDQKFDRPFLFYRAKSLIGLNQLNRALTDLEEFVAHTTNQTLKQDAIVEMIDLNSRLYKQFKERQYLETALKYLKEKEKFIRYYSALELSYLKEKDVASKAVPVLKEIVRLEDNEELINRAKLALMRIDPRYLQETARESDMEDALLKITVYDKIKKKFTMEISIPFALVKMALDSLPDEVSREFSDQDIKLDTIMDIIMEKREVFKMETQESIVKIWLK